MRHIHRLLNERDQIIGNERNWVLNQALNTRKLQNGGTFQNVLTRKLDEVLVPIFSEIIALVDRNYNLDRLDPQIENSPLSQFWLAMFKNSAIVQLHYEDMATRGRHREQVPGAGGRMAEEDFKCQLPFSWLVKEAVDALWHSAKSTATGACNLPPPRFHSASILVLRLSIVLWCNHSRRSDLLANHSFYDYGYYRKPGQSVGSADGIFKACP